MKMTDYMQPKWWLSTKRGIGMAMVAVGAVVPVVGAYMGLTIDVATWGQFTAAVAQWFEVTWNVVAYGLWLFGSFYPTAPLTVSLSADGGPTEVVK